MISKRRAFLAYPGGQRSPSHPSGSAYPRIGGPSRLLRRAQIRVPQGCRRCSAGKRAARKVTSARNGRPSSPAGAATLTRAERRVRPLAPASEPSSHGRGEEPHSPDPRGAPLRTEVVLIGDGREGFMQVVGAHSQRLALLTALVMAVLAQHHSHLLRRRPMGVVGRGCALRVGHGQPGGPSFPTRSLGFSFLQGNSGGGSGENRARVRVSRLKLGPEKGSRVPSCAGQAVLAGSAGSEPRSAPSRGR